MDEDLKKEIETIKAYFMIGITDVQQDDFEYLIGLSS